MNLIGVSKTVCNASQANSARKRCLEKNNATSLDFYVWIMGQNKSKTLTHNYRFYALENSNSPILTLKALRILISLLIFDATFASHLKFVKFTIKNTNNSLNSWTDKKGSPKKGGGGWKRSTFRAPLANITTFKIT